MSKLIIRLACLYLLCIPSKSLIIGINNNLNKRILGSLLCNSNGKSLDSSFAFDNLANVLFSMSFDTSLIVLTTYNVNKKEEIQKGSQHVLSRDLLRYNNGSHPIPADSLTLPMGWNRVDIKWKSFSYGNLLWLQDLKKDDRRNMLTSTNYNTNLQKKEHNFRWKETISLSPNNKRFYDRLPLTIANTIALSYQLDYQIEEIQRILLSYSAQRYSQRNPMLSLTNSAPGLDNQDLMTSSNLLGLLQQAQSMLSNDIEVR